MVKRKRVGLLFSYNEQWIAGTYYILNIIKALNTIEDSKKPIIVIITDDKKNIKLVKKQTQYPYLKPILLTKNLTKYKRGINKLGHILGLGITYKKSIKNPSIDFLYPFKNDKIIADKLPNVSWIPDFQEEFLPHFFSKEEIAARKGSQKKIAESKGIVVFSSNDAQNHFKQLYPKAIVNTFVLQFAVTHPDFSNLNHSEVLKKYKLPQNYFFTPNQFWAHKNQMIILKAVKLLKDKEIDVFVAFSGKDYDYRNADYVKTLKEYIKANGLEENISFLGFIDRKEQLVLLKNSIAVVQPSLFEGWSTVVEDAKALNKYIILSDLKVHKEQINLNCDFFDKTNEVELANLLHKYILNKPSETFYDYQINIKNFGENFIKLINLGS